MKPVANQQIKKGQFQDFKVEIKFFVKNIFMKNLTSFCETVEL